MKLDSFRKDYLRIFY